MAKGWRHEKFRSSETCLSKRMLKIDADGFLPADLEPAEVDKASRVPGWSFCDRQGPEIVSNKRAEVEKTAKDLRRQVANGRAALEQLERKLADTEQRALQLVSEEAEAVLRVKQAEAEALNTDVSSLSWDRLRTFAAEHGISSAGQPREDIEAALTAVLAPRIEKATKAVDEVAPHPKENKRAAKQAVAQ